MCVQYITLQTVFNWLPVTHSTHLLSKQFYAPDQTSSQQRPRPGRLAVVQVFRRTSSLVTSDITEPCLKHFKSAKKTKTFASLFKSEKLNLVCLSFERWPNAGQQQQTIWKWVESIYHQTLYHQNSSCSFKGLHNPSFMWDLMIFLLPGERGWILKRKHRQGDCSYGMRAERAPRIRVEALASIQMIQTQKKAAID